MADDIVTRLTALNHPDAADACDEIERLRRLGDTMARYGFGGWDDLRPTSECLHCHGTGMCDEVNECGFCVADGEARRG